MTEPEKRFFKVGVLEKPPGCGDLPLSPTECMFVLDMATVTGFGASVENAGGTRVCALGGFWLEVAMSPEDFEEAFQAFTGHGIWTAGKRE